MADDYATWNPPAEADWEDDAADERPSVPLHVYAELYPDELTTPPPARVQPDIGDEARDLQDSERAQELDDLRRRLADAERERDEWKAIHADFQRSTIGIYNKLWDLVYKDGKADWEYPGQVLNHLRVYLEEKDAALADAQATVEQMRDALDKAEDWLSSHCGPFSGDKDFEAMMQTVALALQQDDEATPYRQPSDIDAAQQYEHEPDGWQQLNRVALAARPAAAEEE